MKIWKVSYNVFEGKRHPTTGRMFYKLQRRAQRFATEEKATKFYSQIYQSALFLQILTPTEVLIDVEDLK